MLCIAQCAAQFPGILSSDDLDQIRQVRAGMIDDWRPPIIARLLQALFALGAGPAPLFCASVAALWCAIALFATTLWNAGRRISAALVPLIGLVPYSVYRMGTISADTIFAAILLLAFALILLGRSSARRIATISGIALACLAVLFRHNAVCALGPALTYAARPKILARPVLCLMMSGAIAAASLPVTHLVNRTALGAVPTRVTDSLRLFDLAGIAAMSGDMTIFGADSRVSLADIEICYTPVAWDTLSQSGRCGWFSEKAGLGPAPDALRSVDRGAGPIGPLWSRAILRHPIAYAEHRLAHFNSATFFFVAVGHRNAVWASQGEIRPVHGVTGEIAYFLRYSPLFCPAFVLALGIAVVTATLAAGTPRKDEIASCALALGASGLLYGVAYLLVGVASVERYFLFPDFAVPIAFLLTFSETRLGRSVGANTPLLAFCIALPIATLVTMYAGRLTLPTPSVVAPRAAR